MLGMALCPIGLLVVPYPTMMDSIGHPTHHTFAAPRAAAANVAKVFPGGGTTNLLSFVQPAGLGAPRASKVNPANGGNAEGNWWTPSAALDTDCEGKAVSASNPLTKECVYEKKVAEIKARQAISQENAEFKVQKLKAAEEKAAAVAAKQARRDAETKERQAKYAARR